MAHKINLLLTIIKMLFIQYYYLFRKIKENTFCISLKAIIIFCTILIIKVIYMRLIIIMAVKAIKVNFILLKFYYY
jgi:hypothetical protein